jgi:hypothetical protein
MIPGITRVVEFSVKGRRPPRGEVSHGVSSWDALETNGQETAERIALFFSKATRPARPILGAGRACGLRLEPSTTSSQGPPALSERTNHPQLTGGPIVASSLRLRHAKPRGGRWSASQYGDWLRVFEAPVPVLWGHRPDMQFRRECTAAWRRSWRGEIGPSTQPAAMIFRTFGSHVPVRSTPLPALTLSALHTPVLTPAPPLQSECTSRRP